MAPVWVDVPMGADERLSVLAATAVKPVVLPKVVVPRLRLSRSRMLALTPVLASATAL
jgi:hypothetical protein